ncbi:hypothetical protein [Modestobacter versicolor]
MSEPHEDETVNLHPGQHDEGGHGGMATRELEAKHEHEHEQEDDAED